VEEVLILGGGSGGTLTANTLDHRRFDVTVVSASREHLFQPALLYVALAGHSPHIVRDERRLLSRHVKLLNERIERVDLRAKRVATAAGTELTYDALVVATGVRAELAQIPGLFQVAERYGNYHSSIAQAQKLWAELDAFRGGTIVLGQASPVCVCPPSPVEGILAIDRLLRKRGLRDKARLVFFTPFPRAFAGEAVNEIVEPILKARGIAVMTFFDLDSIDTSTRTITSIEGDRIEYDLPIIVPPVTGADIAYEPADVLTVDGFLRADKATLRIPGVDNAFAVGDAADLPTSKAGVGAHLQSQVVVKELAGERARFDGRTNCPLDLSDGTGTFVISSYTSPSIRYEATRTKHLMKRLMGRIYWMTLSGRFEPVFVRYFALTEPEKLSKPHHPTRILDPLALLIAFVAVVTIVLAPTRAFSLAIVAVALVYVAIVGAVHWAGRAHQHSRPRSTS
jgi:sulfide:quinone oxidoreductase